MVYLQKSALPVYGKGVENISDWIYVDDHIDAIWMNLENGRQGEVYAVGGECEKRNIDLLDLLIEAFSKHINVNDPGFYRSFITFVQDRPGHDLRYAIDCTKIKRELGWAPRHTISEGMRKTIAWYLENSIWIGTPFLKQQK